MKSIKVLLINPNTEDIIRGELPFFINKNLGNLPPLGLLYIYGVLKDEEGVEVNFLDCAEKNYKYYDIRRYVEEYNPTIVGITTITHNLVTVLKTAEKIKQVSEDIHINIGGPHVTLFPEESLRLKYIDSITVGDGEEPFSNFASNYNSTHIVDIEGIYFKGKGYSKFNPNIIEDINRMSFPDRECIVDKNYNYVLSEYDKVATMVSSRGCPFNCSFCLVSNFKYRKRSVNNVIKEVNRCIELGYEEIYFLDDTFNANIDWLHEFCERIKEKEISWSFRGRIQGMDEETIKKLKKSNCKRIHFGVESSSKKGLKELNKGIEREEISRVFSNCRKWGIKTVGYFLIGCPHEKNKEEVRKNFVFIKNLSPDYCMFNILTIYPKTPLHKKALKKGIIKEKTWKNFLSHPYSNFKLPFWKEHFNRKELMKLLIEAYIRFYFRISFIIKNISLILKRVF